MMDYLISFFQVLAAYLLADFLSGVYHFATDKGFNFRRQVLVFQDHHETNTMEGFDWQPMVAGLPAMVFGLWIESPFLLALGSFGCLAQVPHYYAHRKANRAVKFLQRWGIIISPKHHAGHHSGNFNRNFCIISGWCNPLFNKLTERF